MDMLRGMLGRLILSIGGCQPCKKQEPGLERCSKGRAASCVCAPRLRREANSTGGRVDAALHQDGGHMPVHAGYTGHWSHRRRDAVHHDRLRPCFAVADLTWRADDEGLSRAVPSIRGHLAVPLGQGGLADPATDRLSRAESLRGVFPHPRRGRERGLGREGAGWAAMGGDVFGHGGCPESPSSGPSWSHWVTAGASLEEERAFCQKRAFFSKNIDIF